MRKNYRIICLLFLFACTLSACSDKDNPGPKGTHFVQINPFFFGVQHLKNVKIFVSEAPFESYETFKPLSETDLPEDIKANESVPVDVSAYVGKTVYFTVMRKHQLTDAYFNITADNDSQDPANLKVDVVEDETNYELLCIINEMEYGKYEADVVKLTLTVRQGSNPVTNHKVYKFIFPPEEWSDQSKQIIEDEFADIGSSLTAVRVNEDLTDVNGKIQIDIPVNEVLLDYNSYIIFVLDDQGKLHFTQVDLTDLELSANITY